jgi:hypothetical protein
MRAWQVWVGRKEMARLGLNGLWRKNVSRCMAGNHNFIPPAVKTVVFTGGALLTIDTHRVFGRIRPYSTQLRLDYKEASIN